MPEGTEAASITIDAERLRRILRALQLASANEYDACLGIFAGASEDDRFADLEVSFSVFVRELAGSKATASAALARHQTAALELKERIATIELQNQTILELSTPIIEVWDGVLCLPLVGVIDSERSAAMTEQLLDTVVRTGAATTIVDITGVDLIDTRIADQLVKMSKAVRLLGADCILSGINPRIAHTLTSLGIDLQGLTTVRSLRDGLERKLAKSNDRSAGKGETAP